MMRITKERADSNIRVTQTEILIQKAVVKAVETIDELTDAELVEAITNSLSTNVRRIRQRETKPYHQE